MFKINDQIQVPQELLDMIKKDLGIDISNPNGFINEIRSDGRGCIELINGEKMIIDSHHITFNYSLNKADKILKGGMACLYDRKEVFLNQKT